MNNHYTYLYIQSSPLTLPSDMLFNEFHESVQFDSYLIFHVIETLIFAASNTNCSKFVYDQTRLEFYSITMCDRIGNNLFKCWRRVNEAPIFSCCVRNESDPGISTTFGNNNKYGSTILIIDSIKVLR